MAAAARKVASMFCARCHKRIASTDPKVVIGGAYHCQKCVYEIEMEEARGRSTEAA